MNRCILLILFLTPLILPAQYPYGKGRPHVVKDNVKCLYGLKNDSNQWIVPPQYTTLSDNRTYFTAGNSQSQLGIINLRGRLVLPVIYDRVIPTGDYYQNEPDLFVVSRDSLFGIVDSSGQYLLPLDYQYISPIGLAPLPHRYFILKKNNQFALIDQTLKYFMPFSDLNLQTSGQDWINWKLRVVDKQGRYGLADSTGLRIQPLYGSINALQGEYYVVSDKKTGLKGVVSITGDTILPFTHREIFSTGNPEKRIVARTDGTFGILDSSLHVVIAENTKYVESQYSDYPQYMLRNSKDTAAARQQSKWGIMTGNGVWTTPQIYDTIIYPDFAPKDESFHFIVMLNGKYGVIGTSGQIIIPIEYDMLVQCSDVQTRSSQMGCMVTTYETGSYFYVGKKNGKFGATKSNGQSMIPYAYDTIVTKYAFNDWRYRNDPNAVYADADLYFIGSGNPIYLKRGANLSLYSSGSSVSTLTWFFDVNKEIKVYQSGGTYYPFRETIIRGKKMLIPAPDVHVVPDRNNYDQLQVTIPYSDLLYFDRNTGKQIVNPLEGVNLVARAGQNHIFQSEQRTLGIISPQGKVLLKPAYIGLKQISAYDGKQYLWTKMSDDTTCGSYDPKNDCACGWRLCNLNGVPVVNYVFDFPHALNRETVPVVINGKVGLFNVPKLKMMSAVVYKDIVPSCINHQYNSWGQYYCGNDSVFYVTRENGQFGVMNKNGKWLTDSTCDYMIAYPRRNYLPNYSKTLSQFDGNRWMLYSSAGRVIIDEQGRVARDSALFDSLILESYSTRMYTGYNYGWGGRDPEYLNCGPQVGCWYNLPLPNSKNYAEQDSLRKATLREGTELVLSLFGYRYQQKPGSYSIGATAYVVGKQWTHESSGYLKTVQPVKSENLKADVIYISDKALSLQTLFNPDTAKSASSNPFPFYLNFQRTASGELVPVTLDSIFCPTVQYQFVLNKLIREAVQRNDRLNIDCGNEEAFFARTQGKFFFNDTGLVFHLQTVLIGIPWRLLQPYSRPGGIVDKFMGNQNGEHCRPAYDTTAINYTAQGFTTMKQLRSSGYLSREKITSWNYIFSDSANHVVNGFRYCNGSDMVLDVFFEPVKVKNADPGSMVYDEKTKLPRVIRKKRIVNFYSIKHYPCVH